MKIFKIPGIENFEKFHDIVLYFCLFSIILLFSFFSIIILDILCLLLWVASIDGRLPPLAACHCSDYCTVA